MTKPVTNEDIQRLESEIQDLKTMISKLLAPAAAMTISEKARAIKRAEATGDPKIFRQTLKQINRG